LESDIAEVRKRAAKLEIKVGKQFDQEDRYFFLTSASLKLKISLILRKTGSKPVYKLRYGRPSAGCRQPFAFEPPCAYEREIHAADIPPARTP
jgi:hypothetical protein